MSKRMYHINPNTGVPTRCYAKGGRCPYGGTSGMSHHYKTFTEAQVYAEEVIEDQYRKFPAHVYELNDLIENEMLQEKTNRNAHEVREFLKLDRDSQVRMIRTTKSIKLLVGVINGDIGDGDWEVIGPALQNVNVPHELLQDILFKASGAFNDETQRWAVTNKSLSADDLRRVIRGKKRNPEIKALAFANDNIEKEYLDFRVNKGTLESNGSLPEAMIFYDKRNEGKVPWADHYSKTVKESEHYKETAIKAEELFNKYIKSNMNS